MRYNGCNYLSIPELKLIHVGPIGDWSTMRCTAKLLSTNNYHLLKLSLPRPTLSHDLSFAFKAFYTTHVTEVKWISQYCGRWCLFRLRHPHYTERDVDKITDIQTCLAFCTVPWSVTTNINSVLKPEVLQGSVASQSSAILNDVIQPTRGNPETR